MNTFKGLIILNKKNIRDYQIGKKFVAGLVLFGSEVKSLRLKQVSLTTTCILIQKEEIFVHNLIISNYQKSRLTENYQKRKIKLLLQKKEIFKIVNELKGSSKILLPISIFFTEKGWAKLEFAIAQNLRKYQIKAEEKDREIKKKILRKDFNFYFPFSFLFRFT